jgi:hypothetical protein
MDIPPSTVAITIYHEVSKHRQALFQVSFWFLSILPATWELPSAAGNTSFSQVVVDWAKRGPVMRSAMSHANPKATGLTWRCMAWSVQGRVLTILLSNFHLHFDFADPGLSSWLCTVDMYAVLCKSCNPVAKVRHEKQYGLVFMDGGSNIINPTIPITYNITEILWLNFFS